MYLYNVIKNVEVAGKISYRIPLRIGDELEMQLLEDCPAEDVVMEESNLDKELRERLLFQAEEKLREAETARKTADELILQARKDAEKIRIESRSQAELEREKILLEARSAGRAEGYQEGLAKAATEGEEIRAAAKEVLCQTEEIRRSTLDSMEDNIIGVAVEIAERLIAAHLSVDPESVCNIAKESLRLLEDRMMVVIYINPAELSLYESKMEELRIILPAKAELQVITDDTILPCGCRIETENGTVDATMETRRKAILKALYGEGV